jgi:hypothetical protein
VGGACSTGGTRSGRACLLTADASRRTIRSRGPRQATTSACRTDTGTAPLPTDICTPTSRELRASLAAQPRASPSVLPGARLGHSTHHRAVLGPAATRGTTVERQPGWRRSWLARRQISPASIGQGLPAGRCAGRLSRPSRFLHPAYAVAGVESGVGLAVRVSRGVARRVGERGRKDRGRACLCCRLDFCELGLVERPVDAPNGARVP